MTNTNKVMSACVLAIAVGAIFVFWPAVQGSLGARVYSAGFVPYVLKQHYRTVGSHGDRVIQNIVVSQSSDSSKVRQTYDLLTGMDIRQITHANGVVQEVYDKIKVVSSTREPSLQSQLDPASNCLLPSKGHLQSAYILLGEEKMGGVLTNKIMAGENSGFTLWNAPSLACATLASKRTFSDSVSTLEFDSLSQGEPEPGVFTVPADYAELPPSRAKFRLLKSASIAIPEDDITTIISRMSRVDADYASKRP